AGRERRVRLGGGARHPGRGGRDLRDPQRHGPHLTHIKGTLPSPNIWHHTATYELENRAADPQGALWDAMTSAAGPDGGAGRDVLDLGCGAGYHLPRFAGTARTVTGVEP